MHPLRFCPEHPVLIGELNPFPLLLARERLHGCSLGVVGVQMRQVVICKSICPVLKIDDLFVGL